MTVTTSTRAAAFAAEHALRDRIAQVARLFAIRSVRTADLDFDSIEFWVSDLMRNDGRREACALAIKTGLPLSETHGLIASTLRRYYLARRMAALPPAMRYLAIRCQNPTVPVLLGLMERMAPEDRNGMDPIRATRRLYVCTQAQAQVQRERYALMDPPASEFA